MIALVIRRPKGDLLKESLRLLPDLLRLLRQLTTNRDLPTGVRIRLRSPCGITDYLIGNSKVMRSCKDER
jgi:hypothetical protein